MQTQIFILSEKDCNEKSDYLSGKHLERRAENSMQKLPLHIVHIIPTNMLWNEEIPESRTTKSEHFPKPIIEIERKRRRTTIHTNQLQTIPIPVVPRNPTGFPNHHR